MGRLDRLAGEQSIECHRQVIVIDLIAHVADPAAIVDPPRIAHDAVLVEHEDFRRAGSAQLAGHRVIQVLEQRELDARGAGESGDLADRVLAIRVDADKRHTPRPVLRGQLGEPRPVKFRQRALCADEGHAPQRCGPRSRGASIPFQGGS